MDDLELIRDCVSQAAGAWDRFTRQYTRLIYSSILNVLKRSVNSSHGDDLAKDIFQDILAGLVRDDYKKLRGFQGRNGCSLSGWLCVVSANATRDFLRRHKEHVSLNQAEPEESSLQDRLTAPGLQAAQLLFKKEEVETLQDCIGALNSAERYFVDMHFYRGVGLELLRGHLKLSRGAVDMQKARLLRRLRDCFRKKGLDLQAGRV